MNFPTTTATNHLLPCGLTVILDPNPDHPVLSAQIWIETGSKDEVEHIGSGISHLLEHMVFKGTKSFDCATLAQSVQEKGGHWNAYTSFDRTVYYIDGPSSSSDFFLKTLTELVFHPTLPLEDYETERDVIRREIDMGLDDPDSVASHLLFENAYQHDLRRHPVIGHLDRFNQLTHDDLLNYHKHRYLPSNSFLVLAGDFDSDQVLTELKNLTSDLPNTPTQPLTQPAEPRPIGPRIARKEFPTPISHLTLSWPIPAASHPDIPALEAFAQALGGGRSSALYQRFREQETLCHHISTWAWTPPQGPGIFAISAEVDADRRDQLEATLQAELPALIQSLADEDLQKAIRQIFTTQFRTLTSASGRASDLGSNWHEARNLNLTRDYLQAIAQVTLPQIQAAAQTYLTPDTLTLTSLDPEGRNSPAKANKSKQTTPEFQEHTLSNGLRVLLRHDSRLPTIDLQIAFLAGLPSESPETNGISTLHASTLLLGTEQKSSAEFALALESLGARLRLATGNNTAFLSGYCLADDLPTYLALLGEALTQPLFDPKAISRESQTQLAVIQEAAEDPLKMAFYHLRNAVFGNTHYGLPKLGREETVSTLTTDHLRTHHQDHFTAANAVLALTGDLPPTEQVLTLLEETLAPLPTGQALNHRIDATLPATPGEHLYHLDREQAVLTIGLRGLSFDSPDTAAAELFQEHTSNMAGPLFTRIREELGLAYYVSSNQFHGLGTGLFSLYLGTSPDQLPLARTELENTLETIATKGLTQTDLDRARIATLSGLDIEAQSPSAQARSAALDTLLGLGLQHSQQHRQALETLTVDQLNTFIPTLLTQQKVTSIVQPPPPQR